MNNFTTYGRTKAQEKMRKAREGWPRVTTTWDKALGEGFRRFDEPGMKVKLKPNLVVKREGW